MIKEKAEHKNFMNDCGKSETTKSIEISQSRNQRNVSLIEKARSGDTEAFEELLTSNHDFLAYIASGYMNCNIEFEEITAMCKYALYKAYLSFDISKDVFFITYAGTLMRNEINAALRKNKKNVKAEYSLDEEIGDSKWTSHELVEDDYIYRNPSQLLIHQEEIRLLKEAIEQLPERERTIIVRSYFHRDTQTEIGKSMNLSQKSVSILAKQTLNQLKQTLKRTGAF